MATCGISGKQAAVSGFGELKTIVAFRIVVFHKWRESGSVLG
jgi:hypothetical protein